MNIIIVGAGNMGSYLASKLSREAHNVIIVDHDSKLLEKISQNADVATRLGTGTDWHLLEELQEQNPDLFIAMTGSDETNLVACTIAKHLGYPKTIARIRQSSYLNRSRLDFGRLFCVDHLIAIDLILAHDLFKCITNPGNGALETFAHGAVQMRTIVIPPHWKQANKKIVDLQFAENLLLGLIRRQTSSTEGSLPQDTLIFPRGQDRIFSGDEVTLIGEAKVILNLHKIFGIPQNTPYSVVIAGASPLSFHLSRLLEEQGIAVKILEQDEQKCHKLAEKLPLTTILNQDPTDSRFLRSERIDQADFFIACSDSDEKNILASIAAKQVGCKETISLVSDENYIPLLKQMGISSLVSERACVAKRVDAILDADTIVSGTSLYENRAKIMEIKVSTNSEIVGIPLSDLSAHLPKDFLIAMIENRGRISIAKGNNILSPGDTAIVICNPKRIEELRKIF